MEQTVSEYDLWGPWTGSTLQPHPPIRYRRRIGRQGWWIIVSVAAAISIGTLLAVIL